MKIETITFTERLNTGNYNHFELTATAKIEEKDNALTAMLELKHLVSMGIRNELSSYKEEPVEVVVPEPVVEAPVKEKKPKAKKEKTKNELWTHEGVIQPSEVPVYSDGGVTTQIKEEPKGKNVVVYNSNLPEHKSIFGGYLANKYGNAWKTVNTVDEIKAFTASLNGKHFLDDQGNIAPSFLDLVHGFFG